MTLEVIYIYFVCYQNHSYQIWAQPEQADPQVDFNLFKMS